MKVDIWDVRMPNYKDHCAPVSYELAVRKGGIMLRIIAQKEHPIEQEKLWRLRPGNCPLPPKITVEKGGLGWSTPENSQALCWIEFQIIHADGEMGPCYEAAGEIIKQAGRLVTSPRSADKPRQVA